MLHLTSFQSAATATWNAWSSLGGDLTSDIAVAANEDFRLEVFARGIDNALWHNSQLSAGGPAWSGWTSLGERKVATLNENFQPPVNVLAHNQIAG
jgi:hypothetical protein